MRLTRTQLNILKIEQLRVFLVHIIDKVEASENKEVEIAHFKNKYGDYKDYMKWSKPKMIRYLMQFSPKTQK